MGKSRGNHAPSGQEVSAARLRVVNTKMQLRWLGRIEIQGMRLNQEIANLPILSGRIETVMLGKNSTRFIYRMQEKTPFSRRRRGYAPISQQPARSPPHNFAAPSAKVVAEQFQLIIKSALIGTWGWIGSGANNSYNTKLPFTCGSAPQSLSCASNAGANSRMAGRVIRGRPAATPAE